MTPVASQHRTDSIVVGVAGAAAVCGTCAGALGRYFIAALAVAFTATCFTAIAIRRSAGVSRFAARMVLLSDPRVAAPIDGVTAGSSAGLLIFLAVLFLPTWRHPPPLMPIYDDHQWTSLNIAATRSACGAPSSRPDVDIAERLSGRSDVESSIREIAPFSCASIWAFVISENTLMLIEAAVLRLDPHASLATIARTLLAIQFAGLALFAIALCTSGVPPLWCALVLLGAHALIRALLDQYMYAVYPLMIPAIAGLIGIVTIGTRARSTPAHLAVAVAVGLAIGPIVNLRTDLLPGCVAVIILWLFASSSPARALWQLIIIGAGAAVFQLAFIQPIQSAEPQRPTRHSVMHPVVLALAVPENPVAKSLGLRWDDTVGWDLAQRLKPGLNVNTPDYEQALRRFYVGLWRERTGDMLGLYWLKFREASRSTALDSTAIGFDGQFWRAVLRPLSVGANGWPVPLLLTIAVIAGAIASRLWPQSWAVPMTLLVAAGALNWLECALIFSHFTPQYYGLAFAALIACCLMLYQLAWQWAWSPMTGSLFPVDRYGSGYDRSSSPRISSRRARAYAARNSDTRP